MRTLSGKFIFAAVSTILGIMLSGGIASATPACGSGGNSDFTFVSSVTIGGDVFSAYNAACNAAVDNWTVAEAFAVSKGGQLASIDNATVNADVESLVNGLANPVPNSFGVTPVGPLAWIGLYQPDQYSSTLKWVNGDTTTYTNWSGGYPYLDPTFQYSSYTLIGGSDFSGQWADFERDTPSIVVGAIVETAAPVATPEPSTLVLFALACAMALIIYGRNKLRVA